MNNDTENRNYYNRIHYGTTQIDECCPKCQVPTEICNCEDDDDNDDLLISDDF